MIKNKTVIILLIIFLIISNFTLLAYKPGKPGKVTTVVIDAGHGGKDTGALGKKSKEKDIALAIVLKIGKLIENNFSDVKVVYTRKTDEFIDLYRRPQIANEIHADLFISIHCNSNPSTTPYGYETYVMGLNKSKSNLEVAKKENAVILLEDDYSSKYDGYNPNSPEANIIFSLFQNAYLDQSLDFSAKVQKCLKKVRTKSADRGVKQAGFLVLCKTTMPSVLIETGFISNKDEEEYLMSENGKNEIAKSIFNAFKEYKFKVEGFNNQLKIVENTENINKSLEDSNVTNNTNRDETKNSKEIVEKTNKLNITKDSLLQQVTFRIQFATSAIDKPLDAPEFSNLKDIKKYFHNGLFKYTVGNEKSLREANELLLKTQDKGFKDAFVVAFLNEQRISPAEAVKLLKK